MTMKKSLFTVALLGFVAAPAFAAEPEVKPAAELTEEQRQTSYDFHKEYAAYIKSEENPLTSLHITSSRCPLSKWSKRYQNLTVMRQNCTPSGTSKSDTIGRRCGYCCNMQEQLFRKGEIIFFCKIEKDHISALAELNNDPNTIHHSNFVMLFNDATPEETATFWRTFSHFPKDIVEVVTKKLIAENRTHHLNTAAVQEEARQQ